MQPSARSKRHSRMRWLQTACLNPPTLSEYSRRLQRILHPIKPSDPAAVRDLFKPQLESQCGDISSVGISVTWLGLVFPWTPASSQRRCCAQGPPPHAGPRGACLRDACPRHACLSDAACDACLLRSCLPCHHRIRLYTQRPHNEAHDHAPHLAPPGNRRGGEEVQAHQAEVGEI